jgi:hypothetical protein
LEHSRDTNLHLRTQLPDRRKALAGVQRALVDKFGDVIRDSLVEQFRASSFLSSHVADTNAPFTFLADTAAEKSDQYSWKKIQLLWC